MGEKRTLPVTSQTLHSINEAMPSFMRSVNPFGRLHGQFDDISGESRTPIIRGSKPAPNGVCFENRASVARTPMLSSGSETEIDTLLEHGPFRRAIRPEVIEEVIQNSPYAKKRAPVTVLWPNVNAKKSRSASNMPANTTWEDSKPEATPTSNTHATPTTDDLVRQVHDELQGFSVRPINAVEESAKKRRDRMVHEASGRMRQDEQAKKMKAMYTKNLPPVTAGDAVTLKLMPNQRANGHRGILGIVVEVSANNTVRVVTEHGIISGSRDRDFWFSPDLYKVHKTSSPLRGSETMLPDGTPTDLGCMDWLQP
jgi:hypothetical protein